MGLVRSARTAGGLFERMGAWMRQWTIDMSPARPQQERLFPLSKAGTESNVKQQARKIKLQGPRCRETRFPRNGQTQVSPTSCPHGMSVEHITATSTHTITTTIVQTPQTVDGRMIQLGLCPLVRICSVQSLCGSAKKKKKKTTHLLAHWRRRKQEIDETRLATPLPQASWGQQLGIEHDDMIIQTSVSSSKCGLRHSSSNYV